MYNSQLLSKFLVSRKCCLDIMSGDSTPCVKVSAMPFLWNSFIGLLNAIRSAAITVRSVVVVDVARRIDIPILLLFNDLNIKRRMVISAISHVSLLDYSVSSDCCITIIKWCPLTQSLSVY